MLKAISETTLLSAAVVVLATPEAVSAAASAVASVEAAVAQRLGLTLS